MRAGVSGGDDNCRFVSGECQAMRHESSRLAELHSMVITRPADGLNLPALALSCGKSRPQAAVHLNSGMNPA